MSEREGNVTDKIKDQLANGGISSGDIAEFTRSVNKESEEDRVDPLTEDSTVDVPKEAKDDQLMQAGDMTEQQNDVQRAIAEDPSGMNYAPDLSILEPIALDEVDITSEEKELFIDSLVTGDRFKLPFSLFNGKVEGTIQNRLNGETRAIIQEVNRRTVVEEISPVRFSELVRQAILRFQIVEVNNKTYEPVTGDLHAMVSEEDGKEVVKEPKWYKEAETFFGSDKNEAFTAALYRAVQIFEAKYWAMVKNAENQDFWDPEDSTSE